MDEKRPWVTCFLTDILLSYLEENFQGKSTIDYPALFMEAEAFEAPPDSNSYLTDSNNWVPLSVLRELERQCERIAGRKDFAYLATRAYFLRKKGPSSLFEIIVGILNDVRTAFVFANLWATAQTNYLRLQSFEKTGEPLTLYMLAQFDENAMPTLGTVNLIRGFSEGFPRLYPFVGETKCTEEISQIRTDTLLREFPDYEISARGNVLYIRPMNSREPIAEARKVTLTSEIVPLSGEFRLTTPDGAVISPKGGEIKVLTTEASPAPEGKGESPSAYQIVKPGLLINGSLSYALEPGWIFSAPYSRFRFSWEEGLKPNKEVSADRLRTEISRLLFEHLKIMKQNQTRTIELTTEKRRLTLENIRLREEIEREYSFSGMVGQSEKMKGLFGIVRSISETDVTALIQGETGTGKELIAKAIHYNSPRRGKRFVSVNCGAISETLLESELFGHEKGAFTGATSQRKGIFEVADGGTLFLDEIGEITPSTQIKLLRVLQEGEFQRVGSTDSVRVNVRIIAATNQNLEELVKSGRFRQDLYYRLNVFPIFVPPLRERAEDVPSLVFHFIEKAKQRLKRVIRDISPQTMALLMTYGWPGNVRELENIIQRMMVVAKADFLDVQDLPAEIRGNISPGRTVAKDLKEITKESAEMIEKKAILDALADTNGNVTRAAKTLGISRATLQNKMKLYGLRDQRN